MRCAPYTGAAAAPPYPDARETRHSDGAPRAHRTSHRACHPHVPLALTCRAPLSPPPSPPSLGFAFGDLKPENILLTASGHAKLTDFGAARPLPGHAAAIAALASAGNVILELRDGDWRAKRQATAAPAGTEGAHGGGGGGAAEGEPPEEAAEPMEQEEQMEQGGEEEEDTRLEGTALYLSPELVRGGRPTVASDCWALGCTLYQALCGKPPLWADSDAEVSQGHA